MQSALGTPSRINVRLHPQAPVIDMWECQGTHRRCSAQLYTAPPSLSGAGAELAPCLGGGVLGGRLVAEDGPELHDHVEQLQAVHVREPLQVLIDAGVIQL